MRRLCATLFQLIVFTTCVVTVYLCSEDEFYNPYVRIRTKDGETFSSLYTSGFLDVSSIFGAVICLNGPAVLYTGVQRNKTNAIQVYDEGFLNVYVHRCHSFNEIAPNSSTTKQKGKKSKKHSMMNDDIKIRGIRIFGVTLVSKSRDYRQNSIYQFNHPNLGHNMNHQRIMGTSFTVIGNSNCWCTILPARHPSHEIHKITVCTDAKWNTAVCDVLGGKHYEMNDLFTDEFIQSKQYSWRECEINSPASKPDYHVFEPFSFNVPELNYNIQQPSSQMDSKPTVRHHWEVEATNCIDFPKYDIFLNAHPHC